MKKLLLFFSVVVLFVSAAMAQTTTLSYQAVVRDSHNRLVPDADITVDVSISIGGTEKYYEERAVRTNHNGVVSFSIGGSGRTWPVTGHPGDELSTLTGWANASIAVTFHLSDGDITVNSPVSAVPYALEVSPTSIPAQVQADWTETDNTSAAFINNKPNLATVATSGDYNDLTNTPDLTVYATNAHLDDTLGYYPTINALNDTAANIRGALVDTAADIRNSINMQVTQLQQNIDSTSQHVREALVDTAAAIRADMPAAQVNSNWEATSGVEEILNKPDLTVYATNAHLDDTLSHYPTINDLKDTATHIRSALVDTAAAIRADFPTVNNGTLTITYGSETPVTFTANQDGNSEITIPAPAAPNNGAITVTRNGADVTNGTFTVDQNTNQTIDIAVPTTVAEMTDAADYAKVAANNSFTGTNTVPSGFDMETTTVANCGNVVVNACDLFAVFDSLNRRISALEDALDALMHAVPPTVTVSLSDITSNSMKATADANDNGTAITAYEFCISENSDMSAASCFPSTVANYTFTGLDAYTTYYVTAKATNLAGSGTSSVVNARTPAHAPAGVLGSSLPPKPTGFQVTVSSLDFKEPTEGTVQIFYKQGSDCSADEDGFTAWPVSGTLATGADYTQNLTGLEPLTDYCVMVKLTNVDSITTYGPVNATSGEDIRLIITPETPSLSLCEGATVDDNFTAAPNMGDAEEYSYLWSDGTNTYTTNPVTITFNTAGSKTITCTATHIVEGYTLTATVAVTVTSAGTAPTFSFCENMLVVDIDKSSISDVATLDWGDGSAIENIPATIDEWTPNIWHAYSALGGTYNIVATSTSGCTTTQTVLSERANLTPCTGSAREGGVYAGQGYGGADDGREYADENGIYAVTDYDGNIYPVVKIGSQCWMAENLRTEHSPSTGTTILLGADQPHGIDPSSRASYVSKMAVWASDDAATGQGINLNGKMFYGAYSEMVPRLGLLYNWCAAVDTFKTGESEVSNAKKVENSYAWNTVLNLVNGNRRGICPQGWHLPSEAEWEDMLTAAGVVKGSGSTANSGSGAGKLATGCYWKESNYGDRPGNYNYTERNSSGFSAIPVGNFNHNEYYYAGMAEWAYFWTFTQDSGNVTQQSIRYGIKNDYNGARRRTDKKYLGASIRCVRDAE